LLTVALAFSALARASEETLPVFGYEVVNFYPHDPRAFTEGLFYKDGFLYESTGLEGHSSVRKVALESGEILQQRDLPAAYFGEGIVDWHDHLVQLTWKSQIGFVSDLRSFAPISQFSYEGEGWALTRSDSKIYMSDGTNDLRVLDPKTLKVIGKIAVTAKGRPVDQLNELEWVKGEIFANIWQTNVIARIDPKSGIVTGWIDLTGLLQSQGPVIRKVDVLNGIAYDAARDRLFVTGKLWPLLFEIKLVPKGG
jgi:glutamine cyclotransferase